MSERENLPEVVLLLGRDTSLCDELRNSEPTPGRKRAPTPLRHSPQQRDRVTRGYLRRARAHRLLPTKGAASAAGRGKFAQLSSAEGRN